MEHIENEDGCLLKANLMKISAKIYAIGELIKFRGGEPALDEERVNYGIGEILTDLAADLNSPPKQ